MAWNTPGSDKSGGSDRPPRPSKPGGNGLDDILDRLRGLVGGNGGGNRHIWRWVALLVGLWLAFNSFVLINEQQRGVVLRFGNVSRVLQPGPHLKWPWPIERVNKIAATQIKTFSETMPVLTRDENIVVVELNVQYRVSEPVQYLFGTRDADEMLRQAALSTVREQVGSSTLDTVLGARSELAAAARKQLQASLDAYRTGLVVTELNLPNARPPEAVKPAFDDVNSAQQDKDRLISEAQAYAAQIVPEARGEAASIRAAAEGYKLSSVARAQGDADRFSMLVDAYEDAPDVTRKRLWLETVEEVLANNRKVVGGDSEQLIYVPMEGAGNGSASSNSRSNSNSSSGRGPPLLSPDLLSPTITSTPDGSGSGDEGRAGRTSRPDSREEANR